MVRVIFGEKGTGNSKRIIQMANDSVDETQGSVVFIDAEGQYLFDLKHAIRFIDAGHYNINSPKMFYGFLAGIAAQDFDLQRIYVDGFRKLVKHPLNELEAMFGMFAHQPVDQNLRLSGACRRRNEQRAAPILRRSPLLRRCADLSHAPASFQAPARIPPA